MTQLNFIFQSGVWLGSGTISLITSPEKINFYTKWTIDKEKDHRIKCVQIIEIEGMKEHIINDYTFFDIQADGFKTLLECEHIGKVEGKGIKNTKSVKWSFQAPPHCIGNEIYEKNEDGSYSFKAEYGTKEKFESSIEGKIWLKT